MSTAAPTPDSSAESEISVAGGFPLSLRVTRPHSEAIVLTAVGEIDEATVARFEEVLAPRLLAAVETIVIDLTAVDFLGVTGLRLLSQSHMRARERGLALRVVVTGREPLHALRAAGLESTLCCYSTVAEAMADTSGAPE